LSIANSSPLLARIFLALPLALGNAEAASAQALSATDIVTICSARSQQLDAADAEFSLDQSGLRIRKERGDLKILKGGNLIAQLESFTYFDYIGCVNSLRNGLSAGPETPSFSDVLCSTRTDIDHCYAGNERLEDFLNENIGKTVVLDVSIWDAEVSGDMLCNDAGTSAEAGATDWYFYLPVAQDTDCSLGYTLYASGRELDPDQMITLGFRYGIRGAFHIGRVGSSVYPEY
jgi:hypothetical protein